MTARHATSRHRGRKLPAFVPLGAEPGAGDRDHVLLVPGPEVPQFALTLPDGVRGAQREKIAERQIRDLMNLNPDEADIRPCPDPSGPQGWSRVLVVDKARVAAWRGAARAGCRSVLPDYLALPTAPGIWTLSHAGGLIAARLGPRDGFSIEADAALMIVSRAMTETPPKAVLWLGPDLPEFQSLFQAAGLPILATPEAAEQHGLPVPECLAHGEEGCDLRLDPRRERDRLRRRVLPWRWPVMLALVAVAVWCAALVLETGRMQSRAAEVRAATVELARAEFLQDGPVLDLRVQITSRLEALRDRVRSQREKTSPLDLANRAVTVIAATGAETDEIAFSRAGGLSVSLRVADFAAQDALVEAFRDAGLLAQITESGIGASGGDVRVDLSIGPAEAGQ